MSIWLDIHMIICVWHICISYIYTYIYIYMYDYICVYMHDFICFHMISCVVSIFRCIGWIPNPLGSPSRWFSWIPTRSSSFASRRKLCTSTVPRQAPAMYIFVCFPPCGVCGGVGGRSVSAPVCLQSLCLSLRLFISPPLWWAYVAVGVPKVYVCKYAHMYACR